MMIFLMLVLMHDYFDAPVNASVHVAVHLHFQFFSSSFAETSDSVAAEF